jgi:tetratricopeptide (TPR) repeat protein
MDEAASRDRSVLRGLLALESDRAKASSLSRLLESGERTQESLTEEERKAFEGAPLVELVMARSWASRYDDPQRMISLAETARVLADNLSVRRYGRKVVADLRARAWAELGNAYRVADKLGAAEPALRCAAALAKQGTGSSNLAAHILYLWTVLLRDNRALPESGELLRHIIPHFREAGKLEALVSSLLGLGRVYEQGNEPEKAVVVIFQALKLIVPDPESPRLLLLSGINALAVNLAGSGEFEAARVVLARSRRLYRRSGKLNQYRLCWLEGKIAEGLGKSGSAEAKFNTARLAFARVGKHYDSALVSLDLGLVYARQERHHELIWLVDDMVRTFRALKIARELIASLMLLRKSCEKRFSRETLCVQIETIAATLTELVGRDGGKAA